MLLLLFAGAVSVASGGSVTLTFTIVGGTVTLEQSGS